MKKKFVISMVLGSAGILPAQQQVYETRTWEWKNGRTETAAYVNVYTNSASGDLCVKIKTADGREIGPIVNYLSEKDQAYVKEVSGIGR